MKKIYTLIFLVIFAFALLPAKAQKIGIRAGYQMSNLYKDGSHLSGADPLSSFYLGLFKVKKIVPAIHFGMGLEYFQNGFKAADDNKLVLHYISIPVYIEGKLGPVFALGGLGANFKVSEKLTVNGETTTPTSEQKSKPVDVPAFLGVGVKIAMFTFEARFHWGLVKIKDGASNQYFQLGAAISLGKSK
jgi:hypothetical protein